LVYFESMEVRVLLFASYADALGSPSVMVTLREGATVRDLLTKVKEMAVGHSLPPAPLVAINQEYAAAGDIVRAADEVALIPPVAGG
jgi:molybdopterin converting factor small subunit